MKAAFIMAGIILVLFRHLRISQRTRKKLLYQNSTYRRKDFTTTPRAFDKDDTNYMRDLD